MKDALSHRGPDGDGLESGDGFIFGHRRLAIIDLDHGAQPMVSDDGMIVITYNGEIYNYLELRQELIRDGFRFHTFSDTEVLLRLYERDGANFLGKLNGMFALAIYDKRRSLFFAARDQFGIKPFYYTTLADGSLLFASEIKALLRHPDVYARLDSSALNQYLTFQFCLGEKTLFAGIRKLEPGCSLRLDKSGTRPQLERYWSLSFEIDGHHTEEYFIDKTRLLLQDSIHGQLRSDVPVGAYLSGGLDSSVVTTLAAAQYGKGLACFTGRFAVGVAYDESEYAKLVAAENKCSYFEVVPTAQQFMETLPTLIYHMDEPSAGPGLFPQYMVSKLAKEHVKVVLGGQGGDEMFGGYARYLVAYLEQCLKGAIFETQEEGKHIVTLESLIESLPTLKQYVPMLKSFWSHNLFDSMEERYFQLIDRSSELKGLMQQDVLQDMDSDEVRTDFLKIFNAIESTSYLNKMTHFDQQTLLPALLQVEDRVSMAVSLESRVPLLDTRLAELVASMPPSLKFKGGKSKFVLKQAMHSMLPAAVIDRKDKMGFPVPLKEWWAGPLRDFISDILLGQRCRERGLFDVKGLEKILRTEQQFGRQVWGALCIELWFRAFVDESSRASVKI